MSAATTSNNSQVSSPNRPLTARELLRDLIARNLEIIETRTACLWARSMVAYNTNKSQTPKDMLDALSDLLSAPFLRLGKQYRESPITQEIVAASRKFNNLLIDIKREATIHIRGIATHSVYDPATQRKIERLGLRFPIIKLDIKELIAANEADADADADHAASSTRTEAQTSHISAAQIQPPPPPPPPPQNAAAASAHPADTIITAEIAKLTAAAGTPSTAPTAATPAPNHTPSRTNPFDLPPNPDNRKRNRFKKRRAA